MGQFVEKFEKKTNLATRHAPNTKYGMKIYKIIDNSSKTIRAITKVPLKKCKKTRVFIELYRKNSGKKESNT